MYAEGVSSSSRISSSSSSSVIANIAVECELKTVDTMTAAELKDELRGANLTTTGVRNSLVARVRQHRRGPIGRPSGAGGRNMYG